MTSFGDIVNGLFEAVGAFFTWRNALQLHRDRELRGVYWPTSAFFAAWGLWNLWFYPSLGQWFSAGAGLVLVSGNVAWVVLAIRYRRKPSAEVGDLVASGNVIPITSAIDPETWVLREWERADALGPDNCTICAAVVEGIEAAPFGFGLGPCCYACCDRIGGPVEGHEERIRAALREKAGGTP